MGEHCISSQGDRSLGFLRIKKLETVFDIDDIIRHHECGFTLWGIVKMYFFFNKLFIYTEEQSETATYPI